MKRKMYLIDANILLELLLKRQKFEEAKKSMRQTPRESLNISDFSLYSLGIALFRRRMHGVFSKVVEDLENYEREIISNYTKISLGCLKQYPVIINTNIIINAS